jgi:hypothetical protein
MSLKWLLFWAWVGLMVWLAVIAVARIAVYAALH